MATFFRQRGWLSRTGFLTSISKVERIQRKRTKGWKMPPNTVYVGRASKWGNPYPVKVWGREGSLNMYQGYLEETVAYDPHFLDNLKGKNLACWCPLDKRCHADILIEMLK